MECGSIGNFELGVGRWKSEDGSWELGDGSWEMEVGRWKLGDGSWEIDNLKKLET